MSPTDVFFCCDADVIHFRLRDAQYQYIYFTFKRTRGGWTYERTTRTPVQVDGYLNWVGCRWRLSARRRRRRRCQRRASTRPPAAPAPASVPMANSGGRSGKHTAVGGFSHRSRSGSAERNLQLRQRITGEGGACCLCF